MGRAARRRQIMNINKLAPWNWFTKEHEQEGSKLPSAGQETHPLQGSPLMQLHRDLDRLFSDVWRDFPFGTNPPGRTLGALEPAAWLKPTLDIAANGKEYSVSVELPGVDEKDVQLELERGTLKIRGEKKQEKEDRGNDYYRVERSYGSFQRVLSLPEDASQSGITARFKNGVLTVTIPRNEARRSEARQIPIDA
jgi:HSP20 family protein